MIYLRRAPVFLCLLLAFASVPAASAQRRVVGPITVAVDATEAFRGVFHTKLSIPAKPGPMTLLYPQWLPGEHGPTGPILQMAGLKFTANGATVPWTRDTRDNFTFHIDVPDRAASVDVAFDYLSPTTTSGFTAAASTSESLAILSWNTVVLYPAGFDSDDLTFTSSIRLPAGWKYATSLDVASAAGDAVAFKPASFTTLVDSPLLTGRYFRVVPIGGGDGLPPHEIDMAGESEAALALSAEKADAYRKLVAEAHALFGAHHFAKYHFLVTLSDEVSHFGLEHHESSDNRTAERSLIDDSRWTQFAGLLPHEFVHSWNGKYRRPAGLATGGFQKPMQDDMLWIYEGLTEYLGYVLTARSGLQSPEASREAFAMVAGALDNTSGRSWRPNQDTATMAAQLYNAPGEWANYRRGVDFYSEGVLLWLDVDVTIRTKTNGAKSIEEFVRLFHGAPNSGPMVKPYSFDDVVSALKQVVPNDWRAFLRERLDSVNPRANLAGFENGGWRVVYTDTPNVVGKASEEIGKSLDLTYSGGLTINDEGRIGDIVKGSPADRAALAPNMTIVAVNGRKYSADVMREALVAAKGAGAPIQLIVQNGEYFRTTALDYHDGLRYPHLERDPAKPDLFGKVLEPLVK